MNFYNKALEEFSNKNYKDSIHYFEKSIVYKIEIETSYYNIGVCYMELKDYQSAIIIYNLLIKENNTTNFSIFYNQGICYFNMGDHKNALLNYFKCLKTNPNYSSANNNIAIIYIEDKKYDKAIVHLNKCISLDKDHINFYINISDCYNQLKKYNKSLELSNTGLKLNKESNNLKFLYNNIGLSHKGLNNYKDAIQYFNKCIELDKYYLLAYNNKSICYYNIGDYKKSININEIAYKIDTNNKTIIENLIIYYFDYELFNNIINIDKKHFNANKNNIFLTLIYYIRGDYENFQKCILSNENIKQDICDFKFVLPYKNLLNILFKDFIFEKEKHSNLIYHIGDSHSLSTTNRNIKIKKNIYKFETKLIIGCKAWHLNNSGKFNKFKANFINKINNIKKNNMGKYILISVGEIDCRNNEGILVYHNKSGLSLKDIINNTVGNYVNFLNDVFKNIGNLKIFLCNIPYPNEIYKDSKIIKIINLYNETLKIYIKDTNFEILDLYLVTKNNNSFYIDNNHLSFNLYRQILQSRLDR